MSNIPQADKIEEKGELMPYGIAFEMLSKATPKLDDRALLLIANDLRAKRVKFLQGQADRPGGTARVSKSKPKPTEEERQARTEHLKEQLKLGGLGGLEI